MWNNYEEKVQRVILWKITNRSTSIATCLSFLHSSECKSTDCCYVEMLYTIPQLTLGGEDPNWQQVKWQAQDRSGQWEEEGDVRGQGREGFESCSPKE